MALAAPNAARPQDAPLPPNVIGPVPAPVDSVAARVPRRDVFDVIANILDKPRIEPELSAASPGVNWSLLPSISYNPVYGAAFGGSITGAGRRSNKPGARPIVLSASANYSTEGQLLAQVRGDLYSPEGAWLLRPDIRYMDTTRSTWGLGPVQPAQSEYPMDYLLVRLHGTIYKRVEGPIYVGAGFHFDSYDNIVDHRAVQGESTPFTEYSGGAPTTTNSGGFSLNFLGDTRDNLVNPRRGYLLSGSFRDYSKDLGGDAGWQELLLDVRLYTNIPKKRRHILAVWGSGWLSFGPAPYLSLPASGWDTYGRGARGYLQGRIRGESQLYVEGEYRMELTKDGLLGAVGFLNATFTTMPDSRLFSRGDQGAGFGLRMKFNKKSDTNLVVDYGWGREGQRGLVMAMSEAF